MRATSGTIWDVWNQGGALVGPRSTCGFVTVETGYYLNKSVGAVGSYTKLPIRWFQRADNSQVETIIPNVKSLRIERTLDSDSQTAEIVVVNQNMQFGVPGELGRPGWLAPDRGTSVESRARWGQQPNEWSGVLTEGALLRTYEGFGGANKSLSQAIADGNVVRTGTWLVDKVDITTNGLLTMSCRNMAALLIDQPITDDLVPQFGTDGAEVYIAGVGLDYRRFYDRWVSTPYVAYGNAAGNLKHITGAARGPKEGYWLVGDDGGVFTYGLNFFFGSMGGDTILSPPVVGMASSPDGMGYWLVDSSGAVFAFGDTQYLGGVNNLTLNGPIVAIQAHPTGIGYYLAGSDGGIFCFGTAVPRGSAVGLSAHAMVDLAIRPQGDGYWFVTNIGEIYTFGAAAYLGGNPSLNAGETITGMDVTPSGNGYILVSNTGGVFTYGDANFQGSLPGLGITPNDPVTDVVIHPDNAGYWLVAQDGGVFTFGPIPFLGSLPGQSVNDFPSDGNYLDFVDIIKDLLLWSGFWLYPSTDVNGMPTVNGKLESTGAYSPNPIPSELFDKKPVMDAINSIKEIPAYWFWVDEDGGAVFTSPNYFTMGNNLDDGSRTGVIPDIDERIQITDYQVSRNVSDLRSSVTIKAMNWDTGVTEVTTYIPPGADKLRGMSEPAIFTSPIYLTADERAQMAKLICMQLFFGQRVGSVKCLANPLIQLDDQVRIWERQTAETYVHYVRGIVTEHDFETGEYMMTLTTHWLGDESTWAASAF